MAGSTRQHPEFQQIGFANDERVTNLFLEGALIFIAAQSLRERSHFCCQNDKKEKQRKAKT
jgi:hypothetical protein